jgi:hypothetical protein
VASLPQTLNPYVYVVNNPVNLVDPMGLTGQPPWLAEAKGITNFARMLINLGQVYTAGSRLSALAGGYRTLYSAFNVLMSLGAGTTDWGSLVVGARAVSASGATVSSAGASVKSARTTTSLIRTATTASSGATWLGMASNALGAVSSGLTLYQGVDEASRLFGGGTLPCLKGWDALVSIHGASAMWKMLAGTAGLAAAGAGVVLMFTPVGWLTTAVVVASAVAIGASTNAIVYDIGLGKGWWSDPCNELR